MAHLRRKFYDAARITKTPGSALQVLAFIAKIYRIEKECRERLVRQAISREQFGAQRGEQVRPVLDRFHAWLEERSEQVSPTSKLGEAIGYALEQWSRIARHLDAWFLTPNTNAVEREIRPLVIDRGNWLFNDTPRGAHASAALYSLVGTTKANGLEPYPSLRYLFTHLPAAEGREDLIRLLPTSLTPDDLLALQRSPLAKDAMKTKCGWT